MKKDPDTNVEGRDFDFSGCEESVWECVSGGLLLGWDDMMVVCDGRRGGDCFVVVVVVVGGWESDVNINAGRSRFGTVVCVPFADTLE